MSNFQQQFFAINNNDEQFQEQYQQQEQYQPQQPMFVNGEFVNNACVSNDFHNNMQVFDMNMLPQQNFFVEPGMHFDPNLQFDPSMQFQQQPMYMVDQNNMLVDPNFGCMPAQCDVPHVQCMSRLAVAQQQTADDVMAIENRASNLHDLLQGAKAASANAESSLKTCGDSIGHVCASLRVAHESQQVVSKARRAVSSLLVSVQNSGIERLQTVHENACEIDFELLAELNKVKAVIAELQKLRAAVLPSSDEPSKKRRRRTSGASSSCSTQASDDESETTQTLNLQDRLKIRGNIFSFLRKVQGANIKNLRWSSLRAGKCLDGALKNKIITEEEHAFCSMRVEQQTTAAAMRVVIQHLREYYNSGVQVPSIEEITARANQDLGSFLASVPSLRGSVRLLEDCLLNVNAEVWVNQIFTAPEFVCRMATTISYDMHILSQEIRKVKVGEKLQCIGAPICIDGHMRMKVLLPGNEEGFVSVRSAEKFYMLESLREDDANMSRWVHKKEDISFDPALVFEAMKF